MNKTAQNLTWNCLLTEVKKEVKRQYKMAVDAKEYYTECTLEYLFGIHNLTSDAEGEEMLTCVKDQAVKLYDIANKAFAVNGDKWYQGYMKAMQDLFGSKCLSDVANEVNFTSKEPKPAEPKFHIRQKVKIKGRGHGFEVTAIEKRDDCDEYKYKLAGWRQSFRESQLEPYTEPNLDKESSTCTDDCPSQSRNLSQDPENCDKSDSNRLHIAAMAMQGILSNIDLFKNVLETGMETLDGDRIPYRAVAKASFLFADALINEAEKGGSK